MPGGNLKPKIVSKKINTKIGNIILTNIKKSIRLSPQLYEIKIDNTDIAKKKSNVFDTIINIKKPNNVKKKFFGNFFLTSHGLFIDK
tara:strand:+ start:536 stop:796 length:261 start_codon:yes stop_codon:yes gene_type:complete